MLRGATAAGPLLLALSVAGCGLARSGTKPDPEASGPGTTATGGSGLSSTGGGGAAAHGGTTTTSTGGSGGSVAEDCLMAWMTLDGATAYGLCCVP
jgi:hypothetical protein